jgi:beta-phosphoglucomutase
MINGNSLIGFKHTIRPINANLIDIEVGGNGIWRVNKDGVKRIFTLKDRKAEFIIYEDKTLVHIKSALGHPAIYQLHDISFQAPAIAVLMDLDGTTVNSENFWIGILEKTVAKLTATPQFSFKPEDLPFISGHSISEHLKYCLATYCPEFMIEKARDIYLKIARYELGQRKVGKGRTEVFCPAQGLKEFLVTLKKEKIKVGLVSSGLYEKAWPEILSAFKILKLGNPLDYYDAIVTAGQSIQKGQTGTLGEISAKPHPWPYAEALRVGLRISPENYNKVVGIEDSSAGIISIRLSGFTAIGLNSGNIQSSGADILLHKKATNLMEALPFILGNNS